MEQTIQFTYMDSPMEFVTNEKVFSPKNVDLGTMAMLSQVLFSPDDKVLDLGCGYGVVGITAAKMVGGEQHYDVRYIRRCSSVGETKYCAKSGV